MLALVRLQPPPGYRHMVRCHDALPPHPLGIAAAATRCASLREVEAALQWRLAGSPAGAVLPLALVVPRDTEIARRIALETIAPAALLFEDELSEGYLPHAALEALWSCTLVARLEKGALLMWGMGMDTGEQEVLRQLVRMGAAGRRGEGAARTVGMSVSALGRWLRRRGMPAPGMLLRQVRFQALEAFAGEGMELATAGRLCGWAEKDALRMAVRRRRIDAG